MAFLADTQVFFHQSDFLVDWTLARIARQDPEFGGNPAKLIVQASAEA
jgi:hypothetical protein